MSAISQTAADKMQEWIRKNGFEDTKALLDYANNLALHYGTAISALACEMYDATAAAQGVVVKAAEPVELPSYGTVAKAVNGAKKQSEKLVPNAVARIVKQIGADTTLKNAMRDGAEWAWVPMGDTCAFCITLASRGWQMQRKTAHAEHIHANCDCQYAIRFDGKSGVEGYDPEVYREMYDNAEGATPQEKINSMRRELHFRKLKEDEKNFVTFNASGKDVIKPRNVMKNLNKTDAGKTALDYIKDSNTEVRLLYGVTQDFGEESKMLLGYYDLIDDYIAIFADRTKTVQKTAEILVHEATHKRLGIGGDQYSEFLCCEQEMLHRLGKATLTSEEKESILKEVKKVYSELPWKIGE